MLHGYSRQCRTIDSFLTTAGLLVNMTGMCSNFEDSMVEAKARGLQGQGHKILSSRCRRGRGQSSRTPILGGFLPRNATQRAVMPRRLSVHHSQIQCPTAASCACVLSIVFMVLRPLLINHRPTQKFNQGRGQSSRTPSLFCSDLDRLEP